MGIFLHESELKGQNSEELFLISYQLLFLNFEWLFWFSPACLSFRKIFRPCFFFFFFNTNHALGLLTFFEVKIKEKQMNKTYFLVLGWHSSWKIWVSLIFLNQYCWITALSQLFEYRELDDIKSHTLIILPVAVCSWVICFTLMSLNRSLILGHKEACGIQEDSLAWVTHSF